MALEIRPSNSASSTSDTTKASRSKSSSDLFSINMGAPKAPPAPARQAAAPPPRKTPAPKAPSTQAKSSTPQPGVRETSNKPAASKNSSPADQHSSSDEDDTSSEPTPRTAANAKGAGAPSASRSTAAAKNPPATAQAKTATEDAKQDATNESGMSLLRVLAQSLEGDSEKAAETDTTAVTSSTTETSDDKTAAPADADPNAQALALFTQALAAALGASTATPQAQSNNASAAAGEQPSVTLNDVTSKPSSGTDLVKLLAQKISLDAKVKTDADPSQVSVTDTRSSNTQQNADAAPTFVGPMAHMGIGSHFSVQHPEAAANATAGDLKSPVGTSAWNDELGGHLTWMTQKGLETGSLRVAPEHLGPVEVQISVHNGDASVWFGASHPDTRAALEQALPRLREMFASQGMTLTDSGVSRESPRNQARNSPAPSVNSVTAVGSADVSSPAAARVSLGLVDTYA